MAKKKPAKKTAAKKKVAKKVAKKPARKKPGAKKPGKKAPARRAERLPEGVQRVEVSVLQINDVDPVQLGIQDVSGTPQVFYGTTQIDSEIDDVFDSGTTLNSVTWNVKNNAAYTVDVTFGTGNPTTLRTGESAPPYVMTMPAAGACNSINLYVHRDGQLRHDPILKIKRKDSTGRIPNC